MRNILGVVTLSFSFAGGGWAQEPAPCPALLSPQDVLDCALRNHPSIRRAVAAESQAEYMETVALQRPNPELEARGRFGRFQGESLNKSEATLLHTIETGGKRDSRGEKARAERSSITADALKAREDVALETVLSLYRIRQAQDESSILTKTLASLAAVQAQLKSRPRLTPEQEVSLEVFGLAQSDGRLRLAALEGEQKAIIGSLGLAVAAPFEPKPSLLPKAKEDWPEFPDTTTPGSFSGSDALKARADIQAASADLSSARSLSYPDMKVGPTMEREAEGSSVKQTYGLTLGLPLPLYHRNRAGREYAQRGVRKAEASLLEVQRSLEAERQAELAHYRSAIEALKQAAPAKEVEAKLKRTEEISRRGLIPSSLLLEAYRQVFDMTKSRHEAELAAIRALWRIYAIDGRVLTEKL